MRPRPTSLKNCLSCKLSLSWPSKRCLIIMTSQLVLFFMLVKLVAAPKTWAIKEGTLFKWPACLVSLPRQPASSACLVSLPHQPASTACFVILPFQPALSPCLVTLPCQPALSACLVSLPCQPALSACLVSLPCQPSCLVCAPHKCKCYFERGCFTN
jgi:hypothetical protein